MNEEDKKMMMIELKNQFYINKLIARISDYNNQSEYMRLKYYSNLIHDLKILIQEVQK